MTDVKIYTHKMTNEEILECKEIVNTVLKIVPSYRLEVGNPIYKNGTNADGTYRYSAGGDCYDSLFAIQKEDSYGYNYYIVCVGDRGYFRLNEFNKKYESQYKDRTHMPSEALIYHLINVKASMANIYPENKIVFNEGYCLKISLQDNGYYSFEPIHGYGSGMAMDEVMQYGCSFMEPVFAKETCTACNHSWWFNTRNIPSGEKYECTCPKCGMLLMRKKV